MCGIAAVFSIKGRTNGADESAAARMCAWMGCRGPDGLGQWSDENGRVILAHRRLSIIDLSERGAQPMVDTARQLAITFNGEIYNYKELRRELELNGHAFRTESDTEVLLHLYADRGREMVNELRGMFAFALWDGEKQGLLLARDHFGIKPLYLTEISGTIRAASEVKALIAGGGVDTSPDAAGRVGFFLWGHVPEPLTLYRGIRAVPAGTTLWIDHQGRRELKQYAALSTLFARAESSAPTSGESVEDALRNAALDSLRSHLVADVDVGMFLSSGLDSSTLTALASELAGRVRTVTLGFDEYRGTAEDETPLAEAVARRYDTAHTTVWITREEFRRELDRLVSRMDQPSIDGINTYFVAKAAAESGLKVAMSGLGGDELFGGYPSFRQIPRLVSMVRRIPWSNRLGRLVRSAAAPIIQSGLSPKYAGVIEYGGDVAGAYLLRRALFLPWELEGFMDPELVRCGLSELNTLPALRASIDGVQSARFQISALEANWYMRNQLLRDTDWASMSHSLEVRVPLVDWTFWKTVAALTTLSPELGKQTLASTPAVPLPESVLRRPKTGFQVPTRAWLAHDSTVSAPRGLRGWAQYVYQLAA